MALKWSLVVLLIQLSSGQHVAWYMLNVYAIEYKCILQIPLFYIKILWERLAAGVKIYASRRFYRYNSAADHQSTACFYQNKCFPVFACFLASSHCLC